jgi:predicted RNase H-like nuclease (RuvC/YqgF family)
MNGLLIGIVMGRGLTHWNQYGRREVRLAKENNCNGMAEGLAEADAHRRLNLDEQKLREIEETFDEYEAIGPVSGMWLIKKVRELKHEYKVLQSMAFSFSDKNKALENRITDYKMREDLLKKEHAKLKEEKTEGMNYWYDREKLVVKNLKVATEALEKITDCACLNNGKGDCYEACYCANEISRITLKTIRGNP